MVNSDICRVVVRDRTLPCRLDQRVGIYNLTTGLPVTVTTVRETLNRSGHHPHWSSCTSRTGLGQWLLAGVTVSGGKMQNSFRNPFRPVPVQSHAIWTVQTHRRPSRGLWTECYRDYDGHDAWSIWTTLYLSEQHLEIH